MTNDHSSPGAPPTASLRLSVLMVDVDGVLITGRTGDGRHWACDLETDLGVRQSDLQTAFFAPYWERIIIGEIGLLDTLQTVLRQIAPRVSASALIDYWFAHDARRDERLFDELRRLRNGGLKVFLATNQEHLRAAYLLDQLGLKHLCDGMFHSASVGYRKPQPRFFDEVSVRLGVPPQEVLLLDDQPENVMAARAFGWHAVQWTAGSHLSSVLARYPVKGDT